MNDPYAAQSANSETVTSIQAELLAGKYGTLSRTHVNMSRALYARLNKGIAVLNQGLPEEAHTDAEAAISIAVDQLCKQLGV